MVTKEQVMKSLVREARKTDRFIHQHGDLPLYGATADDIQKGEAEVRSYKVRENRLRRMIERQGYTLKKSRRRDPLATDYSGYMIVDLFNNTIAAGGSPYEFSLSLDEVEVWAKTPKAK